MKRSANNNNRPPTSPPLRSPPAGAAGRTVHQEHPSAPEDQSVASPSAASVSSSRSRAGLSLHMQKQLARDIEAAGGIKVFIGKGEHKLCELLNKREELYGKRADPIRSIIGKKVCRWQLLENQGQHVEKVLNRFKISSYFMQQAEARDKLKTTIKKQQQKTNAKRKNLGENSSFASSSSSGSSSDSSSSSSNTTIGKKVAASAQKLPPVEDFPPLFIEAPTAKTTAIEAKQSTPKPKNLSIQSFPPPPAEANMNPAASPRSPGIPLPRDTGEGFANCCHFFLFMHASPISFYCFAALITVNIDRPEANREAFVFPLKQIDGVKLGADYCGCYIMIPMDVRFVLDDQTVEHYKARLFANNQVLLTVPSWDYSPLYNRDEIVNEVDANVTDAMDDARHAHEENKSTRRWKHLLLEFPGGHELSSKLIYDLAGEDEELDLEIVPFHCSHPSAPNVFNTHHCAAWKVARSDVRASKRGKVEHEENKSKAASLLAKMMKTSPS